MKNNPNKIKIKETVHDIKTKDSKQNIKYFVKDVAIHEKEKSKQMIMGKPKMTRHKIMLQIEWMKYKSNC